MPDNDQDDITRSHVQLAHGSIIGHYRIIERIGAGGMGEVYLAEDTKLDRKVALKFLPLHLCQDADCRARFKREAQAAAKLDHPNIVAVHEVSEFQGRPLFSMQHVEGQSLKGVLSGKALSLDRILEIGIQVCEGLQAAHEKGITHRDIKPSNILIDSHGRARIVDFGLASVMGSDQLTKTGSTLGTIGYMSPEQVRGDRVDHRTDLFSFGVVLYEMITGHAPFTSDSEAATLHAITNTKPEFLARFRREVPAELQTITDKALEKDREVRYQSAKEMSVDLTRLKRERDSGRAAAPGFAESPRIPSLAVLPFTNLSADKENEYFSDGLAEDIIDALAQVPGLRVMARTSAFAFRGKEVDVREIGARLNVEHILEGSVRRVGNHLRVTAQLVKASDGYHLWSQRFDREMTDVFAIQDEISQAIVEKLRVRLAGDRPLVKRYTENLAAYDLCLKARYHLMKLTQEGLELGWHQCEQAITLDPDYALAYAVLAESHLWSAFWGFTNPRESLPKAKSAALRALRLDDRMAEAHSALGAVLGVCEFDWPGAEREFRRALELNPSSAVVRHYYGSWFLRTLGRVEEAAAEMRRACELDPLDPYYNTMVGYLLHITRQFEPAVAQFQHAIDLDPTFFFSYWMLSIPYALHGRFEEAIAAAEKANELAGGKAMTLGELGRVLGLAGRTAEARQLLAELEVRRRSSYVPAFSIAMIHRGLGDMEKGLEWWAKGIEERDLLLETSLKTEPSYDPLRSHPAYHALLRKMNLEP